MSTIAITEGWPLEQLIKLQRSQPSLVQRALQRLLDEDQDLRWSVVINAYLDEEISLARAASLLGLHPLELRERLLEKGIPLHLGPVDKADAQAEVDAIRAWKRKAESLFVSPETLSVEYFDTGQAKVEAIRRWQDETQQEIEMMTEAVLRQQ